MKNTDFPYSAAIFNLDGVLVDTSGHHYTAWRRLANSLGFDFSLEQHEELRGLSRIASLERILEWGAVYMSEAEKLHHADIKNNWYLQLISDVTPQNILPGVVEILNEFRSAGVKLALVSASRSARNVLASTSLDPFFDLILDGNSFKKSIPDPECFLMAAVKMQLPPSECIVFEDAALGVQAALFGGFTVVGIGRKEYLKQAHIVIPGFEKISMNKLAELLPENKSVSTHIFD